MSDVYSWGQFWLPLGIPGNWIDCETLCHMITWDQFVVLKQTPIENDIIRILEIARLVPSKLLGWKELLALWMD